MDNHDCLLIITILSCFPTVYHCSTYLSITFKRRPEHVECDGYQPRVLGRDVHEIGYADPDHGALTSRLWRFSEKPGLDHVIGASLTLFTIDEGGHREVSSVVPDRTTAIHLAYIFL